MRRSTSPPIESGYTITDSGCWEWGGYIDRNGYGKAYDPSLPTGRRMDWAHRVSYRRHRGEIPVRHELDHLCENTRCINPDHLEPVTKPEHARRTFARLGVDQAHGAAARMRRMGMTYAEIADALGMSGRGSAARAVNAAIVKGIVSAADIPRVKHISEEERHDMQLLHSMGIPQTEIASFYGIDSSQVSRICSGLTNGHGKKASQ